MKRAARYKGQEQLIRVFAKARVPADAELLFGGAGDLIDDLRALAFECGIADRVHFLGRINEEDLADVYRLASLFVLVSRKDTRAGEGIPLTPLEAAACGVPVIVGNEDGSIEAVVDEESGFVISPRDDAQLQSVMERCASDAELCGRIGAAGADRMRQLFSLQRFIEEHRALLGRIAEEHGRTAS